MFTFIKTMAKKKVIVKPTEEEIVVASEVTAKKEERDADFYRRHTGARDEVIYG
jgi:hypothetical protein